MKKITLEVISANNDKVSMKQVNHGTFTLTFAKRSPAVQGRKFKIGDLYCLEVKKEI